ncbi:hypothetical protein AAG906_021862 [Vitis piasezkii]
MGAFIGSGRGAQVVATGGLGLLGSCGPSLARIELDNCDFYHAVFSKNEWNRAFLWELEAWVCLASNLPPGLLNADDEEALMLRPECVTQRFLLLIFLSPGGELSVVSHLPTVFFQWLVAILNHLPPLYQMIGFGKVWPSLLVTESK